MSTLPEDLKSKALETPNIPAAVVCPNQESILSAVIEGKNMNLIDPTLIGNNSLIAETAKKLSLDISNFNIVEAKDEEDSASIACQISNENKSKIIIKGNLHTDILMRSYLKKEFNLLDGKRLSHIWHMTTSQLKKPLFITDGALNVLPRVDIKLQILKNAVQFCNKLNITNHPKIIAVSKTFKIDKILPLIEHGHINYGENKVQEAVEKWAEVKKTNSKLKLHMIGKLQTNKVKHAVQIFDYIHSVDSQKLAKKIADEQNKINKKIKIFLQVNIGNEDQKSGVNKIQNVRKIFLSSLFKKNKNFLGINKFKFLSRLTKKKIVVLGGISKENIKKLSLLKKSEFAGISYFE